MIETGPHGREYVENSPISFTLDPTQVAIGDAVHLKLFCDIHEEIVELAQVGGKYVEEVVFAFALEQCPHGRGEPVMLPAVQGQATMQPRARPGQSKSEHGSKSYDSLANPQVFQEDADEDREAFAIAAA
jgi:hypothetical protein